MTDVSWADGLSAVSALASGVTAFIALRIGRTANVIMGRAGTAGVHPYGTGVWELPRRWPPALRRRAFPVRRKQRFKGKSCTHSEVRRHTFANAPRR